LADFLGGGVVGAFSEEIQQETIALHARVAPLDLHSHFLLGGYLLNRDFAARHEPARHWNPLRASIDLPRAREGGLAGQFFTLYCPGKPWVGSRITAVHHALIDRFDSILAANPDSMARCTTAADFRAARAAGRFAAFLGIEGAHCLHGDLEQLDRFASRGVRIFQLTHFVPNGIADSSNPHWHAPSGLTALGRQVLERCHRLGLVVDLAHCSDQAVRDAADCCQGPLIVSHTGVRGLNPIGRNVSDETIRLVAQSGGVIGIILYSFYLTHHGFRVPLDRVVDHLAYVADRVGTEHLAIGTDLDAGTWTPTGFRDVRDLPRLTERMLARGFTEADIGRIWSGNFLNILDKTRES
jgi:membrane dipeptidase